ncbi:MAG: DUF4169 family protein [Myxococcota bacterium]
MIWPGKDRAVNDPTNLRRFRKRKQRSKRELEADQSRLREGIPKADRAASAGSEALRARTLAGKRRDGRGKAPQDPGAA